jgi:hypothetical protein
MEVFPMWPCAQVAVARHARSALPEPRVLRAREWLAADVAERVCEWFTAAPVAPDAAVLRSYRALERDSARLFSIIRDDLDVRVRYTQAEAYASAAELCAELRARRTMTLTTGDQLHPLLGGTLDQLRVIHDVFGHAALGLGFDLQAEFATWLQCRALFSPAARPAAFCELVGAVTAYVLTGSKPALDAKLPPRELLQSATFRG